MAQYANPPVALAGSQKVTNIVGANAGVLLKSGRTVLAGVTVNTAGTGSTLVVYDGTSTSGTKLGTFATTAQLNFDSLGWPCATGLFVVTTGTVADVTLAYT